MCRVSAEPFYVSSYILLKVISAMFSCLADRIRSGKCRLKPPIWCLSVCLSGFSSSDTKTDSPGVARTRHGQRAFRHVCTKADTLLRSDLDKKIVLKLAD